MRSIAKVVHDAIVDHQRFYGNPEIIEFASGTGNTVGFITDSDGAISRVSVESWEGIPNLVRELNDIDDDSAEYLMPTKEFHPCPYEEGVNNDPTALCKCSPSGMQRCRDDI